jgi:uncharacterized membrane protein YozB (DUF420 family)
MSAETGLVSTRIPMESPAAQERQRDRWFFTGMAVAALLTVFTGFAPSYYLGNFFEARPLSTLVHLHGVLFTSWILLFLTQTSLIAARRADLHRRLGVAGGVLAVLMLVVGYLTAVEGARRGVTPPGGPPPLTFLAVPLGALVAFAILVGAGLYGRRRSETHKRMMLLATIVLLTPAIARMRFIGEGGPPVAIGGTCLFVVSCLIYDRAAHGRVHPAFLWGGLFVMLSLPLRMAIGRTDAWGSFAEWLTR